ncbi:hypothetical protein L202_07524 [Cryptococcus amylolentus CBS 6039]|uniref:Phorbol-ester/DAG-type domain-containing protein n=1 Tax=Cryptococcus amylolentus CBS 6039 TaxID=1295533 RepID=A0A1E3HCK4_9TREE|nr:hypothetical protein L202_07524 [Cryptococcus amylolentus CBS 6039]ODN74054.1 hypothetical protein L202_07524 [Cryptococcus amylolentus CBS 6039]
MLGVPSTATDNDGRRALGIRPGGHPLPRLKIDPNPFVDIPPSPTLDYPPSPLSTSSSRHSSSPQALRSPSSPDISKFSSRRATLGRRPTISARKAQQISNYRGLYETQKLLSHLLDKLEQREPAPDILARAVIAARQASGLPKGKGKGKVLKMGQALAAAATHSGSAAHKRHVSVPVGGIGSEDFQEQIVLDEGDWDTEATFNLVQQTRDLFVLAERQDLDLFADNGEADRPILDATPVKNKKGRTGRFSSVSPSTFKGSNATSYEANTSMTSTSVPRASTSTIPSMSGSYLLARALSALHSLISIDCLHRTHLFHPLCPPNALQAACLDIASYLYMKCDVETKVKVVGMVVDGLYGMGEGMGEKVYEWLEGRMENLLRILAKERGGVSEKKEANVDWTDPFSKPPPATTDNHLPTFAISTESPDMENPKSTGPGWKQFSPTSPQFSFFPDQLPGLLSIQAMRDASPTAVQIAALVPRILMAISSTIDLAGSKLTMIHRVHRLLTIILSAKPDSPLDLLSIIAYAPPAPRRTATELLATFYPNVMGHNTIARRLASTTYASQRTKWETGQFSALGEDDTEGHHFVPWRISSKEHLSLESIKCLVCEGEIHGFGIRCTMCREHRHLRCYTTTRSSRGPVGFTYDVMIITPTSSSSHLVHVKFGYSAPTLEEELLSPRFAAVRKAGQHTLRLINLFTLSLCGECRLPLWGTTRQAYACESGCQRLYHAECLGHMDNSQCRHGKEVVVDEISGESSNPFTITPESLGQDFSKHCQGLLLSQSEMESVSFDEVAVLFGALWLQYQLVKNGLSTGSLRIAGEASSSDGKTKTADPLNLRPVLKMYEDYLQVQEEKVSGAMRDFKHVAKLEKPLGTGYLFSEKFLAYCTALIRAPSSESPHSHGNLGEGLLTPQGLPAPNNDVFAEEAGNCYERLPLSFIYETLKGDLFLTSPYSLAAFVNQLIMTGLISLPPHSPLQHDNLLQSQQNQASFSLPLLMDSAPTTEILVLAIESLLDDLDLTMNEQGLRLMVDRAWPSLLCAPYALERLGKAAVGWIMAEEDCLRELITSYASKHRRIPGVRPSPGSLKGSIDAYKNDRQQIRSTYVRDWCKDLHDQDPEMYAHIVYDQCKLAAVNAAAEDSGGANQQQMASKIAGIAANKMAVMAEAGVLFSTVMELLTAWLEDLGPLADHDVAYRSLPRLLSHQPSDSPDIFALSASTTMSNASDFARVCRWMRVLSFSGAEIPWELLQVLIDQQVEFGVDVPPEASLDVVIAVSANGAPLEPKTFAGLCSIMATTVFDNIGPGPGALNRLEFELIKRTMVLVLKAYGVISEDVSDTVLGGTGQQMKQSMSMGKRRGTKFSFVRFPLDARMTLAAANLLERTTCPCEIVLDFIWLLSTKAINVDDPVGFLHHTCERFYVIFWPLIARSVSRRSRARVLLRLLSVNSTPLVKLIHAQSDVSREERTIVRERLLTLILELADSSINHDLVNWRSSAVALILVFFDVLLDNKEVIPDNLVVHKSLLPTHLKAISLCFEEYLVKNSDENRLVLLTRLRRLRLALPQWAVISWETIEEILAEEVTSMSQFQPARKSSVETGLTDSQDVTYALAALGLEMLASGVAVSWVTAQRFQQRVVALASASSASPSAFTSTMLPALRAVLDSPAKILITGHTFETKTRNTASVGSLFVPVAIDLVDDLNAYDHFTQRLLLDVLMVVFFKQNVNRVELAALTCVQQVADFVSLNDCSENRLLGIQILQTAVEKVDRDKIIRAVPPIFNTLALVIANEISAEYCDSAVTDQSKVFLRSIIKSFGRSGLYLQLFRNESERQWLSPKPATESNLCKALQILYAAEQAESLAQVGIFDNLFHDLLDLTRRPRDQVIQILGSFARLVAELCIDLSVEAANDFGSFISRLSKHIAEWGYDYDPNPMLQSCAKVLDLSPSSTLVPLLSQIATILNQCLCHFGVTRQTTLKLLEAGQRAGARAGVENQIKSVLLNVASTAVDGLAVPPVSLHALLKLLNTDLFPHLSPTSKAGPEHHRVLAESGSGCVNILFRGHQTMTSTLLTAELLLDILVEAGTLLCQGEIIIPGTIGRNLTQLTMNAASIQLRSLLFLLLASTNVSMGTSRSRLFALYPLLARATSLSLRASADYMSIQDAEGTGASILSLVFMTLRVAFLAVTDKVAMDANGIFESQKDDVLDEFWARVWPDWNRLFALSFDPKCINGALRSVTHSVFLDLLVFLDAVQSPILIRHGEALTVTLAMLAKYQDSQGMATTAKMQKAGLVLEKAGTLGLGSNVMVNTAAVLKQLREDLLATERIQVLNR